MLKKIVVGSIHNTVYNGVYNENHFNCEYFNRSNISVHLDGQPDAVHSLEPDFENRLFGGADKANTTEDLDVSWTKFDQRYTMYGFDMSTDHNEVFEVSKRGYVHIDVKFDVTLAHTINVIVCTEYENVIQNDSARNVLLD